MPASAETEESGLAHPRLARTLSGHDSAMEALGAMIRRGRLAHGMLIAGPRGIGKATLAYRLAKHLLAPSGTAPLGFEAASPAVYQAERGSLPDLVSIERPWDEKTRKLKAEISVDQIRSLSAFYARHASAGGYRIAIIDSADDLNRNAANALLKLLEEPPQRSLLILISHRPRALLPTIRSRCHYIGLSSVAPVSVSQVLQSSGVPIPQDRIEQLAALADGSPGWALRFVGADGFRLLDQLQALTSRQPMATSRLHEFADAVAKPGAGETYELFLDLLYRRLGEGTPAPARHAPEVWSEARRLEWAEDSLHIDRRSVIIDLVARAAALARI
jgi:DNA polymerase III subunit delta'